MVAGFPVENVQFGEIQFIQDAVLTLQADEVVEAFRIAQCFLQSQDGFPVLNLAYLVGEYLGIFYVEAEQHILDMLDFLLYFLLGFEQVGVVLHFIAEL